jgi:frataxin-like iron-binding protein CyaY
MKATLNDYPIQISRDKNIFTLTVEEGYEWIIMKQSNNMNLNLEFTDDEIGCDGDCDHCLTPIC